MKAHHDVQLQPRGRLVRMEWDHVAGRQVECAIVTDELAYHLHSTICFADGVTLRDLLDLVARDTDLFTMLTSCDCLEEILAEAARTEPVLSDMVALELAWTAEAVQVGASTVLEGTTEFYGLGHRNDQMAVEFASSAALAGLPVLLNEGFNVMGGENMDATLLATTRRFTLLEVVCGIIDELTFLGSPEERNEALNDLRNRLSDAEDGDFHSIDEVREEMERRAEEGKRKFPCRMCGNDNRCACFGKPQDLCHDCFTRMKEN